VTENQRIKKDFLKTSQNLNVDFISLRFEDQVSNIIEVNSEGKIDVTAKQVSGGIIEAVKNGASGQAVFTGSPDIVPFMIEASRIALNLSDKRQRPEFSRESVKDTVSYTGSDHPDSVTADDRIALLQDLRKYALSKRPDLDFRVNFRDIHSRKFYLTNMDTCIDQEDVYSYVVPTVSVTKDSETASIRENLGGRGGFDQLKGLHCDIDRMVEAAVSQAGAEKIDGGAYTVMLDPKLAGLFLHEALGHLLEADYLINNRKMADMLRPGTMIASECFSASDDATFSQGHGSYSYDDQGVRAGRTKLIENGKIASLLHSRETAEYFNTVPTGNARALNFYYQPQVRMSNTYIHSGTLSEDELLKKMGDGFYLRGTVNGETGVENFSFRAAQAFRVKNGVIHSPVKAPMLTGNIFRTLKNVAACADNLKIFTGFCGKNGQIPLPVSFGGPSILVDELILG
jgi:TldD protein